MKKYTYILIFIILGCNTIKESGFSNQRFKQVKSKLDLTRTQYKFLKNNDSIFNEVYKTIEDSVNIYKIKNRLDSFFLKKYSKKDLMIALELERVYKDSPFTFEFKPETSIDTSKALKMNSEAEAKKLIKDIDDAFRKGIEDVKVKKDSLN